MSFPGSQHAFEGNEEMNYKCNFKGTGQHVSSRSPNASHVPKTIVTSALKLPSASPIHLDHTPSVVLLGNQSES